MSSYFPSAPPNDAAALFNAPPQGSVDHRAHRPQPPGSTPPHKTSASHPGGQIFALDELLGITSKTHGSDVAIFSPLANAPQPAIRVAPKLDVDALFVTSTAPASTATVSKPPIATMHSNDWGNSSSKKETKVSNHPNPVHDSPEHPIYSSNESANPLQIQPPKVSSPIASPSAPPSNASETFSLHNTSTSDAATVLPFTPLHTEVARIPKRKNYSEEEPPKEAVGSIGVSAICTEDSELLQTIAKETRISATPQIAKTSTMNTFALMSQTIAEYGDMIAQRRSEIAELQRVNNIRVSSTSYKPAEGSAGSGSVPPQSTVRKLDFVNPIAPPQSASSAAASSVPPSQAAMQTPGGAPPGAAAAVPVREPPRTSMREELMGRLGGEQARIAELTGKINEMYRLEEEQRLKARDYAHAKDRLEAIRDSLTEELKSVQLSKGELEHQNEAKDRRIRDLEEELRALMTKYDTVRAEARSTRVELANTAESLRALQSQHNVALESVKQSTTNEMKLRGDIEALQRDKQQLLKERQALSHKRDELLSKIVSLESSVGSFRTEVHIANDKLEHFTQLHESDQSMILSLTRALESAEGRIMELSDSVAREADGGRDAAERMLSESIAASQRADDSKTALYAKIESLEGMLENLSADFQAYRENAEYNLSDIEERRQQEESKYATARAANEDRISTLEMMLAENSQSAPPTVVPGHVDSASPLVAELQETVLLLDRRCVDLQYALGQSEETRLSQERLVEDISAQLERSKSDMRHLEEELRKVRAAVVTPALHSASSMASPPVTGPPVASDTPAQQPARVQQTPPMGAHTTPPRIDTSAGHKPASSGSEGAKDGTLAMRQHEQIIHRVKAMYEAKLHAAHKSGGGGGTFFLRMSLWMCVIAAIVMMFMDHRSCTHDDFRITS